MSYFQKQIREAITAAFWSGIFIGILAALGALSVYLAVKL